MIHERLKELREEKGLKQEDIAKEFNMGRSTYAHYETNKVQPDICFIKSIANYYNVSIDFLCDNTDRRSPYTKDKKLGEYLNTCEKIYNDFFKK